MPDKIILTKVSDSKFKKTNLNVAVYKSDKGITVRFNYDDDGYVHEEAMVYQTN